MFFFFTDSLTFPDRLRAAREKAGYTGKEFANELGLKYETYIGYENKGREPKQETLIKIADKLNISVDALLGVSAPDATTTDDIKKPLAELHSILQQPTANYDGMEFDTRDRKELSARVQELAKRAEVLAEFKDLDDK